MALNDLYGDGHTVQLAKGGKDDFDHTTFDNAAQHVYTHGGFNAHMMSDADVRALTRETYRVLSSAIGLKQEVPDDLRRLLSESTFVFSGFKTFHELREVSALMQGKDGGFKPWDEFCREVTSIDERYNRNYLRAEYNFAVQSAQMAAKWKDFEKDGDEYLLQYRTAGDDKVRAEHAALHNTTLPINDPFWDEYLPPLDWGCRCTTVQVRRGKYPESNSSDAIAAGERATDTPKKKIFRFNPGKTGNLFPPKHPYFKLTQQAKPVVKQAIEAQIADDLEQQWMDELPDTLTPEQKKAIVQNFKEIEQGLGIVKGKPMTYEQADKQSANPHYDLSRGYKINCQTCAPAYMLRLRGFDITAGNNVKGSKLDWLSTHWSKCWKNTDGTPVDIITFHGWMDSHGYAAMTPARYMDFFREVCQAPGIYEIGVSWKGGGGHCTIIEKMADGTLRYIEPQHDNSPGSGRESNDLARICSRMSSKPYYSRTGIYGVENQDGIIRIDDKLFDSSLLGIFVK